MTKAARVIGHRLGEGEDRATHGRHDERQHYGAKPVKVGPGVKRQAPGLLGGGVAELKAIQPWATSCTMAENMTRATLMAMETRRWVE